MNENDWLKELVIGRRFSIVCVMKRMVSWENWSEKVAAIIPGTYYTYSSEQLRKWQGKDRIDSASNEEANL